ncbi:hypothetical protein BXZ70DRAFT_1055180, partial [Cristinia sonorae]
PPTDGSLPAFWGILDWQAEHHPTVPWVIFPSSSGAEQLRTLTMLDFALASHKVAHALRPGRAGRDGEVVALLLHCDNIHYVATIMGSMRAGLVPFPMSPRNTPEAVVHMMEKTNCHKIVSHSFVNKLVTSVQEILAEKNYSVQVIELPPLDEVLPIIFDQNTDMTEFAEPAYRPPKAGHRPDDVVIYLHSSGSTGFPKPIPLTQKIANLWMSNTFMKQCRERNIRFAMMALPMFHAMGVITQLIMPLAITQAWVAYEPKYPAPPMVPTPMNMLDVAKKTACEAFLCVPTFVEGYAKSDEAIEFLKTLKILLFGGGPLSATTGKKLAAAGVPICSCYGGTEWGPYIYAWDERYPDDPLKMVGNWEWVAFPPEVNPRWIPQDDGSYELQFLDCDTHQSAVLNLPDAKGYATSDLFIPHPTRPDLWRIIGRIDDVIMLASGEKIVPLDQENYLYTRPMLQGAVMFGRARNEPGVLLEPSPDYSFDPNDQVKLEEFRNKVWPYVEEANKLAPAFARIFKEMIIVTHPDKPMGRAGKGTVLRKQVLQSYEAEINAFLSATFLRNRILASLRSSPNPAANAAVSSFSQEFIFANPTLERLTQAIVNLIQPSESDTIDSDKDEIEEMIAKYSARLPAFTPRMATPSEGSLVVLLTGSTGGLGSHLLALLLEDNEVKKVYTLDRGMDVAARQRASFEERRIPLGLLENQKLVPLSADYGQEDLGLSGTVASEIRDSVTHIIHNAWKVDFNLSLNSFESNVHGARNLFDFSTSCKHEVPFIFCSSVSAASRWDASQGLVPEEVLQDSRWAGLNGYAKSKYITERILHSAIQLGHPVMTIRIGQIAGSMTTGSWNVSDWVPIIVKSSLSLGCLPDLPGDVSWFAMDTICHTILDVLHLHERRNLPELMNVVHPRPTPWHNIMEDLNDAFGLGNSLPLIPFEQWTTKVEEMAVNPTGSDLQDVPAIKLLQFLRQVVHSSVSESSRSLRDAEGFPKYDTARARQVSPSLRHTAPLGRDQVKMWVSYWRSKDFL